MSGLEMKYFVLKPKSKDHDDLYAHASREAMRAYAEAIQGENPDLAQELRDWILSELVSLTSIMDD